MITKLLKSWPLSLLMAIAVITLSLAPIGAPEIARDVPFADKWTHMAMYFGVAGIVWFEGLWHKTKANLWLWGCLLAIILGGLMELGQAYLTDYRSGEWMDFAADSVGAILASVCFQFLKGFWRR